MSTTEIEEAQRDADDARELAEEFVEEATEKLAEARRLADEGAEYARAAAEQARREAQQLADEAEQQAGDADARIQAAERVREHTKASAKQTARRLQAQPGNGDLGSYNKPELVELAAGIGIRGTDQHDQGRARRRDCEGVSLEALNGGDRMRLFNRKSQVEQFLESIGDSLDVPRKLPGIGSSKALKAGLLAAGGLAGLTAGSAGISSLRRRGAGDDS